MYRIIQFKRIVLTCYKGDYSESFYSCFKMLKDGTIYLSKVKPSFQQVLKIKGVDYYNKTIGGHI